MPVGDEGPNEKESRRPCRLDEHCIRSPRQRGESQEGEVKPRPKRDVMKPGRRATNPEVQGEIACWNGEATALCATRMHCADALRGCTARWRNSRFALSRVMPIAYFDRLGVPRRS